MIMADIEAGDAKLVESWTAARTGKYLGITDRAVRRLAAEGRLSGYKVRGKTGQEWRIYGDSAEVYLQEKRADSQAQVMRLSDRASAEGVLSALSELTETMKALAASNEELIAELRQAREKPRRSWWPWRKGG